MHHIKKLLHLNINKSFITPSEISNVEIREIPVILLGQLHFSGFASHNLTCLEEYYYFYTIESMKRRNRTNRRLL